jgi:hypothetical protein
MTYREQLNQSIEAARAAYEEAMQRHAAMKNDARVLEDKINALMNMARDHKFNTSLMQLRLSIGGNSLPVM